MAAGLRCGNILVFNSSLDSLDFEVSLFVGILILLDEVLRLENSSVWMDLNDIHVHVFALWDFLSSNDVSHIDDAILITLISIVVEEDVLSVVVGLVYS